MLAPLKDRGLIEQAVDDDENTSCCLSEEIAMLRHSLRQSRQMQKRGATLAARRIVALTNEISLLDEQNRQLRTRLESLESGVAMTTLAQHLLALRRENDELHTATQRLWFLDRTLGAAHRECERLARERDAAMAHLQAASARHQDTD